MLALACPKGKVGLHLAEQMSPTGDLCQLFRLIISPSIVFFPPWPGFMFIIKLLNRVEIATMTQPSSLRVPGDRVASFL